jgi:AcrR family transcriptional regulator
VSVTADERRRQIVEAAVRVFARNGYHGCRVADIAEEAGVAYGLVYHYFSSKERLLEEIFAETWSDVLAACERAREREETGERRLSYIAHFLLSSFRRQPDLVRVLIREVARSPQLDRQTVELRSSLGVITGIVRDAQETGEFRDDVDPTFAATMFYGALEELLTALVFGELDGSDEALGRAEETLMRVFVAGIRRP